MTQFFLYLLESGICLSLFYLIYWFLIKDDTFHKLKRYYLLASVVLSVIIPVLPSTPITKNIEKSILPIRIENVKNSFSQNTFEKLVFGTIPEQEIMYEEIRKSITLFSLLFILYVVGAVYIFFRFLINLWQLLKLIMVNEHKPYGKYSIITLEDEHPTFSFFRYIFLNDNDLNQQEKEDILLHETTHLKQLHSLDIIFIEICKIFFWFIPVIWQYKMSLLKVHECLADNSLVEKKSENILDYQSLLLKQYLSKFKIELAHPFNYSLIKFRINMMTKTKSQWWAKYKLVFALPIIIVSLVAFTNDNLSFPATDNSLQAHLNQNELFKKFIGTWRYEVNKDTSFTLECKAYNDGLDLYLKEEANGKILIEQKGLLYYDSKGDRLIQKNPEANNLSYPIAMWFSSDTLCEAGQIQDTSNPAKVPTERKWQFKSDDLLVLSVLVKDKFIDALILKRKIN